MTATFRIRISGPGQSFLPHYYFGQFNYWQSHIPEASFDSFPT